MQRDWFMYHLHVRSTYKNRLEYPFKPAIDRIVCNFIPKHAKFVVPVISSVLGNSETIFVHFVSWGPEGRYQYSKMFRWEP